MKLFLIAATALTFSAAADVASEWTMDKAHSSLEFGIGHMNLSDFHGRFTDFDVKITAAKNDFTDMKVEMTAKTESVNTDNENRDKHLRSADFFDAENNPEITFKSTAVKANGKGKLKVTGDLTMHGVTKSVTLDAIVNGPITNAFSKKPAAGFTVSGVVKRSDFKLGESTPSSILSEEVKLMANIEMGKAE